MYIKSKCCHKNLNRNKHDVSFDNIHSRESKVYCMCAPITKIRNKTPQQLLEMCGQKDHIPVDLRALLNKLSISCVRYDFSNIERELNRESCSQEKKILGALVTNGDHAVIFCRDQDEEDGHRYRFTVAHELGHCCLEHFDIGQSSVHYVFRTDDEVPDNKEIEANIFAGELLIPEESLKKAIGELVIPSVQSLSKIFAVSENVMLKRLDYLKLPKIVSGYNY